MKICNNDIIDFDAIKCELLTWQHAKDSAPFQDMLKSNRLKTLESEISKPKLISTRKEMIKIQNTKLARQLNLPYSTYEIYKTFYQLGMATTYPQINLLFDIYLAIPVSSSSAERSFSALKRTKTWIRNTLGKERLSNLAILNIEQDLAGTIVIDSRNYTNRYKFFSQII